MTSSRRSTLVILNDAVRERALLEPDSATIDVPDSATIDVPDEAVIPGLEVAVERELMPLGRRLTFRSLAPP